jgi:hypothetical protein
MPNSVVADGVDFVLVFVFAVVVGVDRGATVLVEDDIVLVDT